MTEHIRGGALDLSREAQIRWGLRYIRERYANPAAAWSAWPSRTREKVEMGKRIEMGAPDNPYREAVQVGAYTDFVETPSIRGIGSGPGLLGADIDRIARHHHELGRREAEGEAQQQMSQMRSELADAYDEGYVAGRLLRTQGLAGDFRSRLIDLHFRLMTVENGSKAKAHAALKSVREALDEAMEFADRVRLSDPDAAATLVDDEATLTRLR